MCDLNFDNYNEIEHRHRFAAWVASRATQRGLKGFTIPKGKKIIECSRLKEDLLAGWNAVLFKEFDKWHREKRDKICQISQTSDGNFPEFTHGIAAKLINVYMKVLFLGSVQQVLLTEENKNRQKLIHPPVDKQLLKGIKNNFQEVQRCAGNHDVEFLQFYPTRFDNKPPGTPWTKLGPEQYEKIIDAFRHITNGHGLWKIEKYWKGHQ